MKNLLQQKKEKIICLSCLKKVEVELISYGNGHVAVCPECGKLAYNGK